MRRVDWTERAIADVAALRDRLDAMGSSRTQQTIDAIILSTDWLLATPGVGRPTGFRRWRKWRAGRTPYLIFYEVRRSGLTVTRVLHDRSDWLSAT